jgi:hypothetical protein
MFYIFLQNLSEIFLILRRIRQDIIIEVHRASCKVKILMKLEFSRQIFEKSSDIDFHENPSSGSRTVPRERTDGHDEASSRFRKFCERAQ